jgi:hypothetical protein
VACARGQTDERDREQQQSIHSVRDMGCRVADGRKISRV